MPKTYTMITEDEVRRRGERVIRDREGMSFRMTMMDGMPTVRVGSDDVKSRHSPGFVQGADDANDAKKIAYANYDRKIAQRWQKGDERALGHHRLTKGAA